MVTKFDGKIFIFAVICGIGAIALACVFLSNRIALTRACRMANVLSQDVGVKLLSAHRRIGSDNDTYIHFFENIQTDAEGYFIDQSAETFLKVFNLNIINSADIPLIEDRHDLDSEIIRYCNCMVPLLLLDEGLEASEMHHVVEVFRWLNIGMRKGVNIYAYYSITTLQAELLSKFAAIPHAKSTFLAYPELFLELCGDRFEQTLFFMRVMAYEPYHRFSSSRAGQDSENILNGYFQLMSILAQHNMESLAMTSVVNSYRQEVKKISRKSPLSKFALSMCNAIDYVLLPEIEVRKLQKEVLSMMSE